MDTIYLINYKMEKPLGVFNKFEVMTEFILNRINPRNLPDPSPFVVFSAKISCGTHVTFIPPDQYWNGDLLYKVKLGTNGLWSTYCLGFPSGFNSVSNDLLRNFYQCYSIDNNKVYSEDVVASSHEAALARVQDKLSSIFSLLNKKIE